MSTVEYLKDREWSMGYGQCPECCGVHAGWYGHPCCKDEANIGHKTNCRLAAALAELGESPLMMGQFKPDEGPPS